MADHSDFWVTIATVAPVVTLSCVVLCSTQGGNLVALLHERRNHPRTGLRWVAFVLILAALLNVTAFILETLAFLSALQHLEQDTDGDRELVVFGQMWCLILLGFATVATHVARCSWGLGESNTPVQAR
jgi:hypothetical protein